MFSIKQQNINKIILSFKYFRLLIIVLFLCHSDILLLAQNEQHVSNDTLIKSDSIAINDTLNFENDSIIIDSSTIAKKNKKPVLESEITYSSEDSLIFSVNEQRVYLFEKGVVNYQDIGIKGDYIEFDYNTKVVMAAGVLDTTGKIKVKPEFTQGQDKIEFDTMRYNFESHKGKIKSIITQQDQGYLHSTITKRLENGEIHIKKGKYTTCDAPEPHFYIYLTKAISIPGKQTISGPGYLVFEDIPMPLGLPFGFFPNTNKRTSGFLIPEFRDEQSRGFGLENGGWYFVINDYVDATILGSVYSRGTWGLQAISNYSVKYKYSGRFSSQFFLRRINDDPSFSERKEFKINWNHRQDIKANPTRTFSASVDFSSTSFEKQQGTSFANILENQKNSSISYTKKWPDRPFNLAANINGSQSTQTGKVNATLPSVSFNMESIYPFRSRKNNDGKYNWFENIKISYSSKLDNRIENVQDSTFFTKETFKNMKNGFTHRVPISLDNINIINNLINITPGISYNGTVFPYYIKKTALSDTSIFRGDVIHTDTIRKITYAQGFSTSLSISISPKLYGTFTSTRPNSYIMKVRHVLTPRASFSFSPNMKRFVPDYYRKLPSASSAIMPGKYSEYSIYENQLNPTPTSNGKSASLSLGLSNNLEMKVRSASDTTGEGKKVSIIDNLDFSINYNPYAKINKWSSLNMNGRSTLFKNKLQLQYNAIFNPYAIDTATKRISNRFLFSEKGRLFRLTDAGVSMSFRLESSAGKKNKDESEVDDVDPYKNKQETPDEYDEIGGTVGNEYVDFDIPWSLNVNYSWSYSKPAFKSFINNSITLSGDISVTPKWKIGLNTSYDFVSKEFSATNFSIYRDLHCWEMRFGIVPFGDYKSYSFTIRAKASILHDLKWDKRKTWHDNF